MLIYQDSTDQFIQDVRENRLTDIMYNCFFAAFGKIASPGEVNSWQNSLPRVRDIIEIAGLTDNMIALEYEVPYNQSRIDCLLFGKNESAEASIVLIELKQWTEVIPMEDEGNFIEEYTVETFVGRGNRIVAHPSQQAKGYQNYLKNFVAEFEKPPVLNIFSCAYCHNYTYQGTSGLFEPVYENLIAEYPIYTKKDAKLIGEKIKTLLIKGDGVEVFNRFMRSLIQPSTKLLDNVAKIIKNEQVFSLLNEQLVAKNLIWSKVRKSAKNKEKSVVIVHGGPGTGKSVIALNLLAEAASRRKKVFYGCKSKPFTEGLKNLVKGDGKDLFSNLYRFLPSKIKENDLDLLLVDEAHRIEKNSNHQHTKAQDRTDLPQIDQLIRSAQTSVFFIDDRQNVRSQEIGSSELIREAAIKAGCKLDEVTLDTQYRCININRDWDKIILRIDLIDKIEELLLNSKIGLIEVKNLSVSDGQKIFNIINTEGTQLTAIEVLSAKPNWNREIKNPSADLVDAAKKLYGIIDVKNNNIVRWDVPATLFDRVKGFNSIFSEFNDLKTSEFEKKLTLGFKILSGLLGTGVKKEDINNLSINVSINWELDIDKLIYDFNTYLKILNESEYFKYFLSWKGAIVNLLSDAPALNFLLITYKDWERKGKPVGSSTITKQFQKNCFVLFDRLIYEYINRIWRGSSDALIAQNLKEFATLPDLFTPVEKSKWLNILSDIFDKNIIGDLEITIQTLKPILYHYYCLSRIAGPDTNMYSIEVDHLIPVSLFAVADLNNKEIVQNNLFNLSLLQKQENISKSNYRLNQIDAPWLKEQIKKYAHIDENDYQKYSSINGLDDLKKHRRKYFEDAFGTIRDNALR